MFGSGGLVNFEDFSSRMCVNVETEMLRVVSFVKGNREMAKFSAMPMRVCDEMPDIELQ